jgi:Flp pilus assembly protein TadD
MGQNDQAEMLLRQVVTERPELSEVKYSLGLLLAEEKKYEEAANYLELAAKGMPDNPRVHYNLGLLLDYLGKDVQAESALQRALELEPANIEYLSAIAQYYLKREMYQEAKRIAEQIISRHPNNRLGPQLLEIVKGRMRRERQ